jgi:hypothetical protein
MVEGEVVELHRKVVVIVVFVKDGMGFAPKEELLLGL